MYGSGDAGQGATPAGIRGAMKRGRGIPFALPDPASRAPLCNAPGRPIPRRCEQYSHALQESYIHRAANFTPKSEGQAVQKLLWNMALN